MLIQAKELKSKLANVPDEALIQIKCLTDAGVVERKMLDAVLLSGEKTSPRILLLVVNSEWRDILAEEEAEDEQEIQLMRERIDNL